MGVYQRMKRLKGIPEEEKKESFFVEDKLNKLDNEPELEIPEKKKLNLIEHFHWEIMKNRRRKGLSQKQLAENLGESEIVIQMIEKAKLPENAEILIRKLEQFFQIRLRKVSEMERIMQVKKEEQEPVLLNEEGQELEKIPELEINEIKEGAEAEPEFESKEIEETKKEQENEEPEKDFSGINMEKGEFDIEKANFEDVTIADLKELNRRKIEVTKQEQEEEKKKIEERQKLIEARKEELRMMKEKESKELESYLGGAELLEKEEKDENPEKRDEFDEELI